jgi:tyrosinase
MGDPDTAGGDPIFWLHHANIDRLWKRWLDQGGGRQDATDSAWLNTPFTFYDEDGNAVKLSGQQIVDTLAELNYLYDDDPTPAPQSHRIADITTRVTPAAARAPLILISAPGEPVRRHVLTEAHSSLSIPLRKEATQILSTQLAADSKRRVVLEIDDIQYRGSVGNYYEVYLDLPTGVKPTPNDAHFIGNLSFFALKPHHAHRPADRIAAVTGGRRDFDVTKVVSGLLREHRWDPSKASVTFVPRGLVTQEGEAVAIEVGEKASLGAVSIKVE